MGLWPQLIQVGQENKRAPRLVILRVGVELLVILSFKFSACEVCHNKTLESNNLDK